MTSDNQHDGLSQMLRKERMKSASPELHDMIMQKVRAAEHRRIYRRLVYTFAIRFAAVFFLFALLTNNFLQRVPKGDLVTEIAQIPKKLYTAGLGLFSHFPIILAFIILASLSRVLRFKTDQ